MHFLLPIMWWHLIFVKLKTRGFLILIGVQYHGSLVIVGGDERSIAIRLPVIVNSV